MFALRGIAVSLTFFVLLYLALSAMVALTWRRFEWLQTSERILTDMLFAFRVLPLVASVAITFAFVVPSFQLLEPRSIDEGLGTMPLALGVCALLLIGYGCFGVIKAQTATSRMTARWLEDTTLLSDDALPRGGHAVMFRSRAGAPPLTLVGVRRPKVVVAESTIVLLSHEELQIALKHELAHVQSRDNLKKLIFRCCPFPGMSKLESAWAQTAELAADDAAVSKMEDAVDLAAALVKLSRLVPVQAAPLCTIGFVSGSIDSRVGRLLAWDDPGRKAQARIPARYAVAAACLALLCVVFTYGPVLALTHQMTEWMVR